MTAPVSSLTAGELTAAGKAALMLLVERGALVRVTGGWRGAGRKVSLSVADALRLRGLARQDFSTGRNLLVPTGAGKMLAGVLQERKRA